MLIILFDYSKCTRSILVSIIYNYIQFIRYYVRFPSINFGVRYLYKWKLKYVMLYRYKFHWELISLCISCLLISRFLPRFPLFFSFLFSFRNIWNKILCHYMWQILNKIHTYLIKNHRTMHGALHLNLAVHNLN